METYVERINDYQETIIYVPLTREEMERVLLLMQQLRTRLFKMACKDGSEKAKEIVINESLTFVRFLIKVVSFKKLSYGTADVILSNWSKILQLIPQECDKLKDFDEFSVVKTESEKQLENLKQSLINSDVNLKNSKLKIVKFYLKELNKPNTYAEEK